MKEEIYQCSAIVEKADPPGTPLREYTYHQCKNKASVCRDGEWFCKIHDPVAWAERREKRKQDRRKKRQEREEKNKASFEAWEQEEAAREQLLEVALELANAPIATPQLLNKLNNAAGLFEKSKRT